MTLLSVEDLSVRYATGKTTWFSAVSGFTTHVEEGEAVGLVGESGSGKSSVVLALLGLLDRSAAVSGRATLAGEGELIGGSQRILRQIRGAQIGYVRQNPFSSIQPTLPLGVQFRNALRAHRPRVSRRESDALAVESLEAVGLRDAATLLHMHAHELSGGMAQRVVIALALLHRPRLVFADEPTTGLDLTVQRRVLDTMMQRVRETQSSMILVSHDMGVIANYCNRVVVMYGGCIVEQGDVSQVLSRPSHPYTQSLMAAIPTGRSLPVAAPAGRGTAAPDGCVFAHRCPYRFDACDIRPPLAARSDRHAVACYLPQQEVQRAAV